MGKILCYWVQKTVSMQYMMYLSEYFRYCYNWYWGVLLQTERQGSRSSSSPCPHLPSFRLTVAPTIWVRNHWTHPRYRIHRRKVIFGRKAGCPKKRSSTFGEATRLKSDLNVSAGIPLTSSCRLALHSSAKKSRQSKYGTEYMIVMCYFQY